MENYNKTLRQIGRPALYKFWLCNEVNQICDSPEPLHGRRGLLALPPRALLAAAALAVGHSVGVAHVEARGAARVVLMVVT